MVSKGMEEMIKNSSVIREMFDEGKRLSKIYGEDNVFDFSIGNPNVSPPQEIKDIIYRIINEENPLEIHGYMNNSGYPDVREKIAAHLNERDNLNLALDNIIMTCGAAGGLNIIMKTILNPDDEVIIFAPYFGEYINYVKNYGGRVKIVSCSKETFEPNLNEFRSNINKKTKAVIINSPNNPSGIIYSDSLIQEMVNILEAAENEYGNDICLIADEPYREIIYDDIKLPCIHNYYKNSFVVYSYSKSLSLPGERIGYISINEDMNNLDKIKSSLNIANRILGFVNAPSLFQKVIGESLNLEVDVDSYKENRDIIYNHLVKLGFNCEKPNGAFYIFPKCTIDDDVKFCNELKKFNILAVPGSVFGCSGFFRLSYCISKEKIEKSLNAFDKFVKENNL